MDMVLTRTVKWTPEMSAGLQVANQAVEKTLGSSWWKAWQQARNSSRRASLAW
jgi:hypothetical protein